MTRVAQASQDTPEGTQHESSFGPARVRALTRELAVLALFVAVAVANTGLWSDLGTRFFAGADPETHVWVLWTIATNLLTRPGDLFQGNIYFPFESSALYADPMIGPIFTVLPLRLVSDNPVLFYNAAVLGSLILASYGFYRLALWLHGDAGAALVPALAIPYSAYQMFHVGHLNLLAIGGYPLVLGATLKLLEAPGPAVALALGLAFAFQAATSGYHAFGCAFLCLVIAVWGWRRFLRLRTWLWAATAVAVAATMLLPMMLAFLQMRGHVLWPIDVVTRGSLRLPSSLFRTPALLWSGILPGRGASAFVGFGVLALAAYGLVRGRSPHKRLYVAIASVFFVLALGPFLRVGGSTVAPLPYLLLHNHVPLMDSSRHPATFVSVAVMGVALLAALGAASLRISRHRWLLAALVAVVFAETFRGPVERRSRPEPPEVYAQIAELPPGAIMELPFNDALHQYWATWHGLQTAEGASPHIPPRLIVLQQWVYHDWKRAGAVDLSNTRSVRLLISEFPVRYLLVHRNAPSLFKGVVSATHLNFERLLETPEGHRVYRVFRRDSGRKLRRVFREESLRGRVLDLTLRGPRGSTAIIDLNDMELGSWDVGPGPRRLAIPIPSAAVVRGLNWLRLAVAPAGSGRLVLDDMELR